LEALSCCLLTACSAAAVVAVLVWLI